MNPFLVQLANGNAFLIGLGLVVLATACQMKASGRAIKLLLATVFLTGVALVFLSATPLGRWAYGLWFGLCLMVLPLFSSRLSLRTPASFHRSLIFSLIVASLILVGLELPYHQRPSIPVGANQPVFVLGDSISAGINDSDQTWPRVLAKNSHLNVTNLAHPGATVETALKQASQVSGTKALVLVEIGGNDLLGGTDGKRFGKNLDQLLGRLRAGGHQVVLFELPSLPLQNAFGEAQRTLARKHNVILIPKRVLLRVFSGNGNTIDGLHLSTAGHDALAAEVSAMLVVK